ncbi:hypothetical protein Mapa_009229 [Marchantia paleacea]|nr:hypothetical protein Mapa_009229 [Marchantia paleacea]
MRHTEEFWPGKLFRQLLPGLKFRILCVSYPADARLAEHGPEESDEYLISENLIMNLIHKARVGQRANVPVVLVGHDLGGILIKHFVLSVENTSATCPDEDKRAGLKSFLENLDAVFFFATPHSGANAFQMLASEILEGEQHHMLRFMRVLNNAQSRINSQFAEHRSNSRFKFTTHAIHPTHETNQGRYKGVVVPEGTARFDVDSFYSTPADHFQVCQPEDESSSSVRALSNQLEDAVKKSKRRRTQGEVGRS